VILENAGYIVICDICGIDGGDTCRTYDEACEYGEGWEVQGTAGAMGGRQHVCDECSYGVGAGI